MISDQVAIRRSRTGRALQAIIASAFGVLVAFALATAWLGIGSDGSPVKEWALVAVGLFGMAVLVLKDDRHVALTILLAAGCLLGLAGGVSGVIMLAMVSDVPCLTASLTSWPTGLQCSMFDEPKTVGRYLIAIGAVSTVTLATLPGSPRIWRGGVKRD